ncbi:MAG: MFS transporter [Firmicutes bacterium]|nr:MFS transporter [Bacillota bacterium]
MSVKSKEQAELVRLKAKEKKSLTYLKYMSVIIVVLTIVYVADEITSNMGVMKPFMIFDLFKIPGADTATDEYASAISKMAVASIPTYMLMIVLPLYKTLSDKFGRKIFLVINTIGMGVGLLICMTCRTYIGFIIGSVVWGFFTPNDMQVIYIMEVAPKQHRAKLCSITKGIGLLSVSLIGVFRTIFYDPNQLSTWRLVYLIPVIIALAIGTLCIFLTKETPVYLRRRIEYLEKSDEQRQKEAEEAKQNAAKSGGLKAAAKYIFSHKQLKLLLIVLILFECAVGLTGYGTETMLAYGQSDSAMNTFFILEPIVYAVCAFFSGFLTDAVGRKKSGIIFGIVALVGEIIFIGSAVMGMNPVLLALANGIMYGGLWSFSDLLFLVVPSELAPTEMRATVLGLIQYTALSNILLTIIIGVCYQFIGSRAIGLLQLAFFVPMMIIVILFVKKNLKETQGVDLNAIGKE